MGLFSYTAHSPGDDSLFRKRIRLLCYIIITILAKRDESGIVITKPPQCLPGGRHHGKQANTYF